MCDIENWKNLVTVSLYGNLIPISKGKVKKAKSKSYEKSEYADIN